MSNPATLLSAFWNHSVRRQLILGVALVHAALMSIFVVDVVERQRDFLHREALARAESLSRNLAAASVSSVLANDLMGLEEVTRSLGSAPDMEYACVLDPAGRVLSHSDSRQMGLYVDDPISLSLLERRPEPQRLVLTSQQIDVAAPIVTGSRLLGWARIGLNQSAQRENLRLVTKEGLSYTFLAIIVGGVMALYIARRLTSGLEELVAAVDAVRAGDRSVRADEDRVDEVGRLGAGFNAMLEAVRTGEEKFRTVADFTYDWEYWRAPDGTLVWMSPSCELFTGYTAEAFLKDPDLLRRLVHQDDRALYDAHMHEVEGGSIEPGELDFRVVHRSGHIVWIDHHCQDIARPDGTLLGRRVSNRDITLRKQAEEGLRRWAQVFENAAWGIVVCSPHSRKLEALNPAFAQMHGYTVAELTGMPLASVYPEDTVHMAEENLNFSHQTGHHTFEADHLRKDGSRFPAQMDVTAVKDQHGEVQYRVVNVQDITERRRAQDEIIRAKEAAEAANSAKSDFLAIMSHELRTPLNGIKGMLQILRDNNLNRKEQGLFIGHALDAAGNLALILNDVLDVSRIEAGKMEVLCEPFTIEDVTGPVCETMLMEARCKGLSLDCALDPTLPETLRGDAGRIRQMLLNLMGNAVKFTNEGQVRLEVYPLPPTPAQAAEGLVPIHFVVGDTGIGIADQHLKHIFEPFTQVESPYTRTHGGLGLGLAIVKRLAALLKGGMEVYSEPGQGTQIHLTLPLLGMGGRCEEPQLFRDSEFMRSVVKQAQAAIAPLQVLVVEDDLLNRLTALKYLEHLGHTAQAAASGAAALEAMAERHFDVVLMDIQMPGMDGVEATRRIRQADGKSFDPRTPVIAVTAHAMRGDRKRFLDAGMDDYLSKPYHVEALEAALRRVMAR
ncbi:MAG TPA: response regulator [Humidesulfovibrio sp.]|uniref:response regulator n=1 Tax=Humidesulfovibrio sp. TaxID=2910988 RepID=UPI002C1A0B61|nr:response regulator [Humidesulfovibrio sp.]HWR02819.1 response regulator [Humidesulfovibrio sp.]